MLCKKCNSIATVILRKKDAYCVECFTAATNHKFRSCLGKNKILSRDERVLLALSGSHGSMVLLNLVHNGLAQDNHKKLRIKAVCLYISGLHPDKDRDLEIAQELINACNIYHLDLYIVDIGQYFEQDLKLPEVNLLTKFMKQENEILKTKQQELKPTEFNDFRTKIMQNLLVRIAKEINCKTVFTAETTTTLASNLLSNTVLGRGSQIEYDVGFSDSRDEIVTIVRPMKDISMEELLLYIKLKNVNIPAHEVGVDLKSMQSLIKTFVIDLQENFQATISTVCKTAEKIGSCNEKNRETVCQLCQSDLSVNNKTLTALEATSFSKAVCNGMIKDNNIMSIESTFNVDHDYCYGCRQLNKLKLFYLVFYFHPKMSK